MMSSQYVILIYHNSDISEIYQKCTHYMPLLCEDTHNTVAGRTAEFQDLGSPQINGVEDLSSSTTLPSITTESIGTSLPFVLLSALWAVALIHMRGAK